MQLYIEKSKVIYTVEEHSIFGGLSSSIAELNSSLDKQTKHFSIALPDDYSVSGDYEYLLDYYKLTPSAIADTILKAKMSNLDKYKDCFKEALELDMKLINDNLKYNSVAEWDSIGHMTLMSALEEKFSISMDTDDIIDFSDFKKGIEILKKYSVDIK